MFLVLIILLFVTDLAGSTIKGRITDKETGNGIAQAQIFIEQLKLSEFSDNNGNFIFNNIPASNYTIKVFHFNYKMYKQNISIYSNKEIYLDIKLSRKVYQLPAVKVKKKKKKQDISSYSLNKEKLKSIPGNLGDVIKYVQTLPGVTQIFSGSSIYIVRGGTPYDSKVYFDNLPILLPFHFGGFVSVINSEIIQGINFYAGGFGAEYGDCIGSILEIESEKNYNKFAGKINVNPLTADIYLNSPVNRDSYIITSFRQSYFHLIVAKFLPDFTVFPRFYDYQIKFNYNISSRNQISILLLGSQDKAELKISESLSERLKDSLETFENYFHTQGIIFDTKLSKKLLLKSWFYRNENYFYDSIESYLYLKVKMTTYSVNEEIVYTLNKFNKLETGFGINYDKVYFDNSFEKGSFILYDVTFKTNKTKEESFDSKYYFSYLKHTLNIFQWSISSGIRYETKSYSKEHLVSPRLQFSKSITSKLKLIFSISKYYQFPQVYHISGIMGNPDLPAIVSHHYIGGLIYNIKNRLKIKAELYYKNIDNLIKYSDKTEKFTNEAEGRVNGIEFYIFQNIRNRCWGWISYTYSISERKWGDNSATTLYYFDKTHIINIVLSYKISSRLQIGTKFNYTTGIPLKEIIAVGKERSVIEIFEPTRYPAYHRLDLRMDYRFKMWGLDSNLYLEVLNIYNKKNVIRYIYNSDYSNYKNPYKLYDLPILPFIGLEVWF